MKSPKDLSAVPDVTPPKGGEFDECTTVWGFHTSGERNLRRQRMAAGTRPHHDVARTPLARRAVQAAVSGEVGSTTATMRAAGEPRVVGYPGTLVGAGLVLVAGFGVFVALAAIAANGM